MTRRRKDDGGQCFILARMIHDEVACRASDALFEIVVNNAG